MIEQDKVSFQNMSLKYDFFVRYQQSKDLTICPTTTKRHFRYRFITKSGVLRWLNHYENIKQLSHYGKNPLLRYNYVSDEYNSVASNKTVSLDCQGKHPFIRFYLQQDQVKGKTNLAEIYIHSNLDKLMQLNQNEQQRKQSQKWRGRVQNALLQWRKFVKENIIHQSEVSVAVRIELAPQ